MELKLGFEECFKVFIRVKSKRKVVQVKRMQNRRHKDKSQITGNGHATAKRKMKRKKSPVTAIYGRRLAGQGILRILVCVLSLGSQSHLCHI